MRAAAVHPGGIQTELGRHMTPEARQAADRRHQRRAAGRRRAALPLKTIPQGAATVGLGRRRRRRPMRSAAAIARTATSPRPTTAMASLAPASSPYALDPERAKALWAKSEEMVGERF